MTPHAEAMDGYSYWRQFPVRIYWDAPKQVEGTITRLAEEKTRDGLLPLVALQLSDGTIAEILVSQARLTAAFVEQRPAVGDKVRITYSGEASKAAPGMNPTKEFTLQVRRQGSQSPGRTAETSGKKDSTENVSGTGEKS